MRDTINFAVIGCGRIAPRHISAIHSISEARLVAVCDVSEERARKTAQENKCDYYTDYADILQRQDVDVINICTPSGNHYEITLAAARAKKHVVTEKPMAMNLAQAREMVRVCREEGVKLFVIKQNRYNPPIQKLREALEQGKFGKLFLGNTTVRWQRPQSYYDQDPWRGTKARDGGVLMNQASHHIDMLQWMLGEPESIVGFCGTMTHKIEAEDTGIAIIKFKNGAFGVIEATTSVFPENLEGSISIFGEKGSVKIGGTAMNKIELWKFQDLTPEEAKKIKECPTNPPNVYGYGHLEYLKDVVKSIKENLPPVISGEEGLKSLELIEAIYKSIELGGKEVKLPLEEN